MLDELVKATQPRFMRLTAVFNVRGGIYTHVSAEHRAMAGKARYHPPPGMLILQPLAAHPVSNFASH